MCTNFIDAFLLTYFFSVTTILLPLWTVENSLESNYVPGSFSAKGRAKLMRSSNSTTPIVPANLDKVINQVCVSMSLIRLPFFTHSLILSFSIEFCLSLNKLNRFLIGWIWIKIWPRIIVWIWAIMRQLPTPSPNKK